ncbi:hypothetical protein ACIP93_31155 [Streptomyces sp. NPDC088745]|uniref:hypothetical protein n=1 Tax=Streptomyces sp. NPDC088745 TaxID=3365884 RepID=UPI0037FF8698
MACLTLCYSAPWTGLSAALTGALIAAGATSSGSGGRPRSFYDYECVLDDLAAIQGHYEKTKDPVTLSAIEEDVADLLAERDDIITALAAYL